MFSGLFIGLLFGFLLQRGQFCFVSGFRRLHQQKNLQFPTALLIAVSVQSVGLFTLNALGLISIPTTPLPLWTTLVGGLLFGIGMTAANCCAGGSWFRSGEGALGSGIALAAFALTMVATQSGALKHHIAAVLASPSDWDNIYLTLKISPWILVGGLVLITLCLTVYQLKFPRYRYVAPTSAVIFPRIFGKPWHPFIAALLIGLLGVAAWYASAANGRHFGFGIAVPSANVVQYLVIGQHRYLNWGTWFVLGIPLGSCISAKLCGEFALRLPTARGVLQRIGGGVLMGIGAALAGGCTVTNALVATAYFSWQGWLATLMIFFGSWWAASTLIKPIQCGI